MSKYKFDRDQLDFDEVRRGLIGRGFTVLKYVVGSILLAVLYYIVYALIFNTKEQEALINRNEMLREGYSRGIERYALLDSVVSELSERDRSIYMSLFKSEPPDFAGDYSSDMYYQIDTSLDRSIVGDSRIKIASLEEIINILNMGAKEVFDSAEMMADSVSMIPSVFPIKDMLVSQTNAGFGLKMHPFYKTMTNHYGIDLLAPIGTEVISTVDGIVKEVIRSDKGRGNHIVITSEKGYTLHYYHLGTMIVQKGKSVKRGDVIARIGNSGLSFAPHLHYEIHLKGKPVDPVNYFFAELSPKSYMEMVTIALNTGQTLD